MTLVIDTCNVLHRTGILPPDLAGIDERSIVNLMESSRYRTSQALLVCDGAPSKDRVAPTNSNVRYMFGPPGVSADDLIMDVIEKSDAPRKLLVVTSDRRILAAARRRRCSVIDSDSFLRQLALDVSRKGAGRGRNASGDNMEAEGVDAWITRFGIDEDLAGIPSADRPEPDPDGVGTPDAPPTPTRPGEEWERLETDELLRRYERGRDDVERDI